MSEEEIINDIKERKYNEQDVEKLLYELENDTGNYSCYDNAIAIIYYKDLYNKEKEKNKELEKYDYRKIKLDEKDKISSIHFTQEQLDLMNLGIALYVGIPKILADEENEETDI